MSEPDLKLAFESKEEFRDICRYLSARLGYLNRVAIGESYFVGAMSDLIGQAGRVFDEHLKDDETQAAFGSGYGAGTIPREDRVAALYALLYLED
ncbi:hypothetical protein Q4555_13870 [Octadecabacter sp. 1_MG-2023]|uniref:hypothetical protein n=1 Tax=unclassified Octadecabacter TaxID=196158 RepID=UPI001C09C43A|nr:MULTISPECIES: hypothetical protein [unclassified Octadecabacter]MBU2991787.1 hypothetical protein [Octadecabacter sp. B2R22]MDO6735760.1 hypothetical protein [Octadecabacter sp. 1_MG-2023]